jgi:hypothetical protein
MGKSIEEIVDTLTICEQLMNQLTSSVITYGDFQQKVELIKRGLDFVVETKSKMNEGGLN